MDESPFAPTFVIIGSLVWTLSCSQSNTPANTPPFKPFKELLFLNVRTRRSWDDFVYLVLSA